MRSFDPIIIDILNAQMLDRQQWTPPGVSLIAARKIWPSTRGEDAVVAVLDTGIDYEHPDLKDRVIGGASFVPGSSNWMDDNGHGTHVAGIIAANGKLQGVAPESHLLTVKVLDKNGVGSYMNISRGLAWARQWRGAHGEKVNVVNLSLGSPTPRSSMHDEIKKAVKAGITVVCAAGNSGDGNADTPEISYPAYYEESMGVGAVDLQTGIANFSNSNDHIDIVAPGVETYSTYPGGRYVKLSGTSMAAPHISGAVALIYSRWRGRFGRYPDPGFVKELLHYQAVDLGKVGFDSLYGFGLFSFNLDGARFIKLFMNRAEYCDNGRKRMMATAPFLQQQVPCGGLKEICELLGTDCTWIPPDGSENNRDGIINIWK